MGVHQEFVGCLVRMGCNASHRTSGRYVHNSSSAASGTLSLSLPAEPSAYVLLTLSGPQLFEVDEIKRELCTHTVFMLHLESLTLSADLEKLLLTSNVIFVLLLKTCL